MTLPEAKQAALDALVYLVGNGSEASRLRAAELLLAQADAPAVRAVVATEWRPDAWTRLKDGGRERIVECNNGGFAAEVLNQAPRYHPTLEAAKADLDAR